MNEPDISEALTPTSRFVLETTEGEPLNDEQMIDENEKGQENNTPINTEQDSYMPTNAEGRKSCLIELKKSRTIIFRSTKKWI